MEAVAENKKNKKPFIIFGVLGLMLLAGVIYFILTAGYESTDNAQIDADIIPVRSSVPGYIKEIRFKDNQQVKAGDTLIIIDDIDLRTRVAQAAASLENAKANLLAVQNNASASTENVTASSLSSASVQQNINSTKARLTKVQADFKRIQNMFNAGAATQAQFDASKAELDIAQAQYDASVNQYNASSSQSRGARSAAAAQNAQVSLAEALVRQRDAELTLAKTQLGYATILAPCTGIVTKRAVEPGQYITVAQPLCSAIDNSHLWITANFKETQVQKIKNGQPVTIKIDAFPGVKLSGKVDSYIGATGAKFSLLPPDNATGNFVKVVQRIPIRIELTSVPEDQKNNLFPGLSAFVEVKVN